VSTPPSRMALASAERVAASLSMAAASAWAGLGGCKRLWEVWFPAGVCPPLGTGESEG
jgi:hypothetical protein